MLICCIVPITVYINTSVFAENSLYFNISVYQHFSECFIFQDALSSPPAALAVRVPPQSPRILFNGSHIMPGQNITVPAGSRATVVCEARYGNPPAYIEWYLGK